MRLTYRYPFFKAMLKTYRVPNSKKKNNKFSELVAISNVFIFWLD